MATKPKILTPWPFTEKSPDPFSRMPACRVFFTGLITAWHVPVCPPFACVFFPSLRSKCRGAGAFPCSLLHPRCWEQCRAHSRRFVSGDPSKALGGLPCATQLSPLLPPATTPCACVQTPGRADHTLAASGSHRSSPVRPPVGRRNGAQRGGRRHCRAGSSARVTYRSPLSTTSLRAALPTAPRVKTAVFRLLILAACGKLADYRRQPRAVLLGSIWQQSRGHSGALG